MNGIPQPEAESSTSFAASKLVDMERAKNDLAEHQAVCEQVASARTAAA